MNPKDVVKIIKAIAEDDEMEIDEKDERAWQDTLMAAKEIRKNFPLAEKLKAEREVANKIHPYVRKLVKEKRKNSVSDLLQAIVKQFGGSVESFAEWARVSPQFVDNYLQPDQPKKTELDMKERIKQVVDILESLELRFSEWISLGGISSTQPQQLFPMTASTAASAESPRTAMPTPEEEEFLAIEKELNRRGLQNLLAP